MRLFRPFLPFFDLLADPGFTLKTPYQKSHAPTDSDRKIIAKYLKQAENISLSLAQLIAFLPQLMPRWGKLKIDDGDTIRATLPALKRDEETRKSNFVHVCSALTILFRC